MQASGIRLVDRDAELARVTRSIQDYFKLLQPDQVSGQSSPVVPRQVRTNEER